MEGMDGGLSKCFRMVKHAWHTVFMKITASIPFPDRSKAKSMDSCQFTSSGNPLVAVRRWRCV
jgi:hypothetical protein